MRIFLTAGLLLFGYTASAGGLYQCTGKDGHRTFQDRPCNIPLDKPLFQGQPPKQQDDEGAGNDDGASGVGLSAANSHYVHGYTRSDGTHVAGYYATKANGTIADNYSTRGNIDPYTGKAGTVSSGGHRR